MTRIFSVPLSMLLLAGAVAGQSQGSLAPGDSSTATTTTIHREDYDPLLDLPPLPQNTVTLVGGTVTNLDAVMNRMVVRPFGSKRPLTVCFDTRTNFFRDGAPISYRDIRQGQRVYLDTMLNGSKVFAKQIWIQTVVESGTARGQILDFDTRHQMLLVRDELSNRPVRLHLTRATVVRNGVQQASNADLVEGALVSFSFGPQQELREVDVVAKPGTTYTFVGQITYVDLSRKLIAIKGTDQNRYDISIEAIPVSIAHQLHEGMEATLSAVFESRGYAAQTIELANPSPAKPK
jgi:hypothetical protein